MENFGERLRKLRGDRPQKDIAAQLGIPTTTLSTMENQDTIPRGEVLRKLAECYKVPIIYFYETDSPQVRSSDAAHAWLQSLREPSVGKDIVATQSNTQLDNETLEKIAERMRSRRAKISRHK
jgi:transcriptional regulator with XRE-family HTH domain